MSRINNTNASRAFDILSGMINSFIVMSLTRNNVVESLGNGAKSAEELAETCKLNLNVLRRTLRYASYIGLVNSEDTTFSLTDTGRYFLKDTPGGLSGSAQLFGLPPWRDSWINFEHCLKTGEPAFNHVFNQPFFEYLDQNQEYGRPFHQYMSDLTKKVTPLIAESYDFSGFNTICDVGGGQGILLKVILERNPDLNGILFDVERVMQRHEMREMGERVSFINGSFFDEIPKADCLLLKTIIHDWNDDDSVKILNNCRNSLNPGGKILLIEQVVEDPFTMASLFYDLHMQVMLGGAERTRQEFRDLLETAGLKLLHIIPTPSPMKIIEIEKL